jgi:hypothetical protein
MANRHRNGEATTTESQFKGLKPRPPPRWAPPGTPLADDGNVLSFAVRRTKLHQERVAKLCPWRRTTLEMLKNSYPDQSEEELLQEMIDWEL